MKKTLPYGVQDYLPDECYNKQNVEARIGATFSACGYDRVETPTFEYYDMYADVLASSDRMFKLTDNDGSLLVLRPDITLQICRIAAKMRPGVKRLYYKANSYEYLPNIHSARTREFAQTGVELLGETGIEGNVEIVKLAIESLLAAGLDDFLIEIGDVRYFKCLMAECGLVKEDAETLKELVNRKDSLGIELFLQRTNMAAHFKEQFLLLPALFGDCSVLETASRGCGASCKKVLDELGVICDHLTADGYGRYISIDLGLLQGLEYYSGLVIRGLSGKMGQSILDGGRYDDIGGRFRSGMHAVGFAIGVKRLLVALDAEKKLKALPPCRYAFADCGDARSVLMQKVNALRKQGARVVDSFCRDRADLERFCRENGIGIGLLVAGGAVVEIAIEEA
ncbi:MAG: ATP phosphoribosyltransferase regulatory subunit [Clostridia bacterium]|jgi:ATP phosphoribosyltransferase regulatory subunit|nr:ATP phosphoribosyltransferase regulatory subunit [Clostridia bacterium]